MNYLQLCQAVVQELAIEGGSGPSSTLGQTDPDMVSIINWVAWSNDYINNLHLDWNFLWQRFTGQNLTIGAGGDIAPTPGGTFLALRSLDRNSCVLNFGTPTPSWLRFWPYEYARRRWSYNKITSRPTGITMRPDKSLELNYLPVAADAFQFDYWGKPPLLNNLAVGQDANLPLLDSDFHRIIIVRTKIMYAEREDAPEIMVGASAEYTDLLAKLEASCWPRQDYTTMSHNNDPEMQFSTSPDDGDSSYYGNRGYP